MSLLLSNSHFRYLWIANLLSMTGSRISRIGLVLYIFHTTNRIADIAFLIALETVPGILLVPFAGVAVDRTSKKVVMILADAGRALCLLAIIIQPSYGMIYLMIALHAIGSVFYEPAKSAALPLIVNSNELPRANGIEQSSNNVVLILGPIIGAELFTRLGLKAALIIDMATFLGSMILISQLRIRSAEGHAEVSAGSTLTNIVEGWRYIARRQLVRHVIVVFFVSLLCVGLWLPLAPFFVTDFLQGSDRVLGFQFGMFGLGGVIGSIVVPGLVEKIGKGQVLFAALLLEGLTMSLYSVVPNAEVSIVICLFWGVIVAAILVPYYSIMQEVVDERFLGRVFSLARHVESVAILMAIGLAVLLQGIFRSNQILLMAGLAYVSLIALSAMTGGGRKLMQTR
ncbi:MAG TPA: MFS transporter [Pyrinomonadaceae bacterium]|nr:MFS transporter [Pyrinomonadaceae bacterium]